MNSEDPNKRVQEEATSTTVMLRLVDEARRTPRPEVRLATLERLKLACDAILSGDAAELSKRIDPRLTVQFARQPLRLNPPLVEAYVRLRNRETPSPKTWTGPTASFIRADKGLREYLQTRLAEEMIVRGPRRLKKSKASYERSLAKLSFEDQMAIREKIEEGLEAKRKLDLLRASLRSMPAVDIDALIEGRRSADREAAQPHPTLDIEGRICLRQLIARFCDPLEMDEFTLVFAAGRLMMKDPPETELVRKREFDLLIALAGESNG